MSVEEADDENGDGRCTVIIALMQKTVDYQIDLSISYQLFRVSPVCSVTAHIALIQQCLWLSWMALVVVGSIFVCLLFYVLATS